MMGFNFNRDRVSIREDYETAFDSALEEKKTEVRISRLDLDPNLVVTLPILLSQPNDFGALPDPSTLRIPTTARTEACEKAFDSMIAARILNPRRRDPDAQTIGPKDLSQPIDFGDLPDPSTFAQ